MAAYYKNEMGVAPPQFMISNMLSNFKEANKILEHLNKEKAKIRSNAQGCHKLEGNPFTFPIMLAFGKTKDAGRFEAGLCKTIHYHLDGEYPLDKMASLEQDEGWRRQLTELYGGITKTQSDRCRIYLNDFEGPDKMFKQDFEVEMNTKIETPLKLMRGSKELKAEMSELLQAKSM